jgi:hypothetical protein
MRGPVDQMLRRSRTPKGSLYYYFPGGKDQLAIETLQYVAGEQRQMMSAIFSALAVAVAVEVAVLADAGVEVLVVVEVGPGHSRSRGG